MRTLQKFALSGGMLFALLFGVLPVAAQTAQPAASPAPAAGQTPPVAGEAAPVAPWEAPEGSLVVNLPSDQVLRDGMLQFLVTHRFPEAVRAGNAHDLYSIDSGTVFGLGFSYSPVKNLETAIFRSGTQDDYELSAKYALRPAELFGVALRAGGDDRRAPLVVTEEGGITPDTRARTSFFSQAILTLHFWSNRAEVSAIPSYASRTSAETRVFNVPVHAAVALSRSLNFQAEYEPPRHALSGSSAQWSFGLEKTLYRHRFSLVISNTTLTNVDEYLSGDYGLAQLRQLRSFDNGFRRNDWHIGFNLIRQFKPGR